MATVAKSLYRLTDEIVAIETELLAIYDEVEEAGGELTPELEARLDAVNARLDEVSGDRKLKIDGIVGVIRNAEMWRERLESEAVTLKSRARVHENTVRRLKDYLLAELRRHGDTRIETVHCDVRRMRNSQPSVRLQDGVVPNWCVRVIPERRELDSRAVLAELRETGQLPSEPGSAEVDIAGVKFAVTLGEHVRIR